MDARDGVPIAVAVDLNAPPPPSVVRRLLSADPTPPYPTPPLDVCARASVRVKHDRSSTPLVLPVATSFTAHYLSLLATVTSVLALSQMATTPFDVDWGCIQRSSAAA